MGLSKKRKIAIAVGVVLSVILLIVFIVNLVCLLNSPEYRQKQQREKNGTDAAALRAVVAEAYIKTCTDPDFVNTATEDQPMEVPEKYYTYVESVQGDGRVYVYIYADGNVTAYFGTPEKVITYYAYPAG